jgi:hypothetical protein
MSGSDHSAPPTPTTTRSRRQGGGPRYRKTSGDLPGYQELQQINADGTIKWSNNVEYGYGTGSFLHGAVYGTWEQSGRREMHSVEIGVIYDGDGNHTETGRVSVAYSFSPDFSTYTAEFIEEFFRPTRIPPIPMKSPYCPSAGPSRPNG